MKHISIFTFSLLIMFSFKSLAQSLDYNDKLPIDKTIKKGVLPNGMTYYIKSTDVVKDAASYYIIQNVGSVLENEDQQGLAHFLEHMAFNGTESFPGKGILNTLQKHGAVFGKDINAYTNFDETVYNLNNIPIKDSLVDTCLIILKDWSNYLLLTDEEIDAERGVIKEEWRTGQNGNARLFQASMPITFNYSKYADRLPIGLMSVVEGFKYKALRDFYHDWYRTDLQAIAVIGDVNVLEIEQKIIKQFSKIPAVENPRERFVVDIPEHDSMLYSLGTDPEISTAALSFGMRHKKPSKQNTIANLKQQLLNSMVMNMLSGRISEESQKPEASFLGARVGYGGLSRTTNVFSTSIYPKENQQQEAFKAILTKVISAVKFGFIQPEIDRAITQVKNTYENQISGINDRSHGQIERAIQNDYLSNITIVDLEKEYEIVKQLLASMTTEEFHKAIQHLYTKKNRFLNVTGVEGQDNLTETQAKQIIYEVENDANIKPYTEDLKEKTLVSGLNIKAGTISKEKINDKIGSTTFVLSNGIQVHYKFVDKDKNNVSLNAMSHGGTSLLKDEDLPSANLLGNLVQMSGLGDFSLTDLRKLLVGKTARVRVGLGSISETVSGGAITKDVETMLQLVHLYFVKPRFDEQAFQVLNNNVSNYLVRKSNDIGEKMSDSLTVALYGKNNPKKPIFNQEYADKISFESIKNIYKERFSNASDFEFFIVGDVKEDQLKPLLEKYIASIPTKNTKEIFKDNTTEWTSNTIDKDVYIKMTDPKATINMMYKKDMPYSLKNSIHTRVFGKILQLRVTETVRESEGGAYSPRASASLSREPRPMAYISFKFDCNPDLADKLVDVVNAELQKIANGDILDEDLHKIKTNFIKERQQSKNKNSYDMRLLTNFFRYDYDMNEAKNFENIVNNITKKDIQEVTANILKDAKTYEIIFKPLKQ